MSHGASLRPFELTPEVGQESSENTQMLSQVNQNSLNSSNVSAAAAAAYVGGISGLAAKASIKPFNDGLSLTKTSSFAKSLQS